MSKITRSLCFFCIIVLIFASCSSTKDTTNSQLFPDRDSELNDILKNASDELINNVPKNTKVVLLNISDIDVDLTDYFIEELGVMLDRSKVLVVVERRYLESLSIEHNFQMSGYVSDESMISIGKYAGAQTVISCNITGTGNLRRLRLRALDVETAIVQYNNSYKIASIEEYTGEKTNVQVAYDTATERAFNEAIRKLIRALPYNVTRIALQNITSESMKEKMIEKLIDEFNVLDRDNVGRVSRGSIRVYYGADVIITGGEFGSDSLKRIVFRAIKVETAEEVAMVMELVNNDSLNLLSLINNICNDIYNVYFNRYNNRYITIPLSSKEGIDLFIEEGIESKLVQSGRYNFIDSKNRGIIRWEIDFQMSGMVSDETTVQLGKHLGAYTIITIGNINNGLINVILTDVETGEIFLNKNYTFVE